MKTPTKDANNNSSNTTTSEDVESQKQQQPLISPSQARLRPTKATHATVTSSSSSSTSSLAMTSLITLLLFLFNVISWYITNGMYGVSMQAFATEIKKHIDDIPGVAIPFLSTVAVTTTATSFQLLCGAVIGYIALVLLDSIRYYQQNHHQLRLPPRYVCFHHFPLVSTITFDINLFLGLLHGLGSNCTNLGFMYGSASIVQIIKLLEPFETLVLSHFLLPRPATPLIYQPKIIASMSLVVGGAISLIKNRKNAPHVLSIVFAIFSGIILSTRNVTQRRQLNMASSSTSTTAIKTLTAKDTTATNGSSDDNANKDEDKPQATTSKNEATSSTKSTSSASRSSTSTLEKSIIQYTKLSFQGGACMGLIAFVIWNVILSHDYLSSNTSEGAAKGKLLHYWNLLLDVEIFIYHPLYNMFSMITLGFVTALTHSLLNAGKRVFAIVLAILWFSENFTSSTVVSLAVVGLGACWYTVEAKKISKK